MDLKLLKRSNIFKGRIFNTVVDEVEYPSGRKSVREVAEHPGGATVLGVLPDGDILMVRQHRYPLNAWVWELPAGKLEPNEEPLVCAKREFLEEAGYTAKDWKFITKIYTSPGFCNETLYLYLATNLEPHPGGRQLEEGEQSMELHKISMGKALEMISNGEIIDAKTIIAIVLGSKLL